MSGWKIYDPNWLVEIAKVQYPNERWLCEALAACINGRWESKAYIHFVDPWSPEWKFDTNIVLEHPTEGDIVLDVLQGKRIGGAEFLSRLL